MLYVEYFFVSLLTRIQIRGIEDLLGARGRRSVKYQGLKGGEEIE